MSNNELLHKKANNTKQLEKDSLELMYKLMIEDAKHNAKSLISDEIMKVSKYQKERDTAKTIITGAIATIMKSCELYGVDSIYQFDNTELEAKLECNTFFIELINEVCHESFNFKS